jgi:hypothetical protein
MAAGIGLSIDIPVLIRTLAKNLRKSGYRPLEVFAADTDFLTYLDGRLGRTGPNELGMRVQEFHLPWWYTGIPKMKYSSYLSFATYKTAIEIHRAKISQIHSLPLTKKRVDMAPELNKPSYTWHPEVEFKTDNPCTRCRLYRAVTLGVYDQLRDLRNLVNACATANAAEVHLTGRRVAGLNALFEAALIKEARGDAVSTVGPGTSASVSGLSAGTAVGSAERKGKGKVRFQFDTLSAGVIPGDKWTYGSRLTKEDVEGLAPGAARLFQLPHSGYDMSLEEKQIRGRANSQDIEGLEDPETRYEDLAGDFPSVSSLDSHHCPVAFCLPPLHHLA